MKNKTWWTWVWTGRVGVGVIVVVSVVVMMLLAAHPLKAKDPSPSSLINRFMFSGHITDVVIDPSHSYFVVLNSDDGSNVVFYCPYNDCGDFKVDDLVTVEGHFGEIVTLCTDEPFANRLEIDNYALWAKP